MSDTGLYLGIYQQIREYAELVDDLIVKLKDPPHDVDKTNIENFGDVLLNISNNKAPDLSTRIIGMILENNKFLTRVNISALGRQLKDLELDKSLLPDLQNLAIALEQERVEVLARMKGVIVE